MGPYKVLIIIGKYALTFWADHAVRACLKTRFGVPLLGGTARKPPKGGTPNLPQRVSMIFFKQALSEVKVSKIEKADRR